MHDCTTIWLRTLYSILTNGGEVAPRGEKTKEILQNTMAIDMRRPVLTFAPRKLSYQFMAAEAFWILSGDNSVAGIAPWNKNIAKFSDDGKTFFGAYGPKLSGQWEYMAAKLIQDNDTRQAGATIWRENPPATKDTPCTISVFFNIRQGKLNCHVFMRSSDVWLGIPYDVFNFSMLAHKMCATLYAKGLTLDPGTLYLTAASQHLYEQHWKPAEDCCIGLARPQNPTPAMLSRSVPYLMDVLSQLRDTKPGHYLRWWEQGCHHIWRTDAPGLIDVCVRCGEARA